MAGILVALHFDEVRAFVERWYRQVIAGAVVMGGIATLWYLIAVWTGSPTGRASDLYQPVAFLWFTAAVAALECGAWMWWRHSTRRPPRGPADLLRRVPGRPDRRDLPVPRALHQSRAFGARGRGHHAPPRLGGDGRRHFRAHHGERRALHGAHPAHPVALGPRRSRAGRAAGAPRAGGAGAALPPSDAPTSTSRWCASRRPCEARVRDRLSASATGVGCCENSQRRAVLRQRRNNTYSVHLRNRKPTWRLTS